MSYTVKTQVLVDTIAFLRNASQGLKSGRIDAKDATAVARVEREVISAVGMDIKARTALPKITAAELNQTPAA
jgi:hypothetical protein